MNAKEFVLWFLKDKDQSGYNPAKLEYISTIMELYHKYKISESMLKWVKYNFKDSNSHPPCPGRYLIYREKCDKMHFEQWNGNGWSSSNNDCTHWCEPERP